MKTTRLDERLNRTSSKVEAGTHYLRSFGVGLQTMLRGARIEQHAGWTAHYQRLDHAGGSIPDHDRRSKRELAQAQSPRLSHL